MTGLGLRGSRRRGHAARRAATSCRSPGTTAISYASCGQKSKTGALRRKRAEAEQRELDEARRIQRKLLPRACRRSTAGRSPHRGSRRPASAATATTRSRSGGSRLGLSIADVVGKGIPAALLMSNLQAAVRAFATEAAQPAELCQQVNRILCGRIAEDRFISFFYCVVDSELGPADVRQRRPLRADPRPRRRAGRAARCRRPVLGVFPDAVYGQDRIPIGSGDRLVLFTDGITEARDAGRRGVRRGSPGGARARASGCSAPALQARITETVSAFTDGRFQDDATLIVMAAE